MELIVKNIETGKGTVQASQLKWKHSWIFIIEAPKGTITCGSFDIDLLGSAGMVAAKIVPEPGKPAYTIEEFVQRKITHVNDPASGLGITVGMDAISAAEKLF